MKIYGIKNCNSMKKAFDWFDERNIAYDFHDYKKQAPDADVIKKAINAKGWDVVINKKGTTWRKLTDAEKEGMDAEKALDVALQNPSIIKRPLIVNGTDFVIGFDEGLYKQSFL